jgi:hypothetical protein
MPAGRASPSACPTRGHSQPRGAPLSKKRPRPQPHPRNAAPPWPATPQEREVAPVITEYWERAEFPFELLPKLAALGLGGATMQGYGCPVRARRSSRQRGAARRAGRRPPRSSGRALLLSAAQRLRPTI